MPAQVHYSQKTDGTPAMPHSTSLATSTVQVSAFCRAVIMKVLPYELISGNKSDGCNWRHLMLPIDQFVQARRFESFTLEHVLKGMKVTNQPCSPFALRLIIAGWRAVLASTSKQGCERADGIERLSKALRVARRARVLHL